MRDFGNLTPSQAKEALDKLSDLVVIFDNAGATKAANELGADGGIMADLEAAFPGIVPDYDCVWIPTRKPGR